MIPLKTDAGWHPLAVAGAVGLALAAELALALLVSPIVPLALVLGLLIWLGLRPGFFGPVGAELSTRIVRVGGYGLIGVGLLIGVASDDKFGLRHPKPVYAVLLTVYAGVLVAATARRSRFGGTGLAVAAVAGLVAGVVSFVVMPFERIGTPLADGLPGHGRWLLAVTFGAPVVAGLLAGYRSRRVEQGVLAAVCTGTVAALLVALLGLAAIVLFPDRIPDIMGNVMIPSTTAAEHQAANATEAADPYAGVLAFGALLAVILWILARPPAPVVIRMALVLLAGLPPIALGLAAEHFPGATALAVATGILVLAGVAAAPWSKPARLAT